MSYLAPAEVGISDNYAAHIARDSAEPGTDYKTAYGTDLRVPAKGKIIVADRSNEGAEGRRLSILLDDGRVVDWIHLASIQASVGDRVSRGQRGVAKSGASGFGKDRRYGPHVHVTLRARRGLPFEQTLNFENFLGTQSAGARASGLSKSAVRGIQRALNTLGHGLFVDGVLGAKTIAAIKAFQRSQKLVVDGIWGPKTNAAYNRIVVSRRAAVRQGSRGALVKIVQRKLGLKQDGIFGRDTRVAVIAFQKKNGLYPDGIVGSKTWQNLGH